MKIEKVFLMFKSIRMLTCFLKNIRVKTNILEYNNNSFVKIFLTETNVQFLLQT